MRDLAFFCRNIRDLVENRGEKRELQLRAGAGISVFMGLICGIKGIERNTGFQLLRKNRKLAKANLYCV